MVLGKRDKLYIRKAILMKDIKLFDSATRLWREIEINLLKQRWGSRLNKAKKVLDLGCGEGIIAKTIFNKKLEYGLDNDEQMVKKAKKSKVYKKIILADGAKIPLADNSVDLVFSNSVLEHIENIDGVLMEVERILSKKGQLIFTAPSDKLGEYIGLGKSYGWWFNKKYSHYHLYSLDKWRKLLAKYNLKFIDSYYYLDKEIIKLWHKLLWMNKFGLKQTVNIDLMIKKADYLKDGAGVALIAEKI